MHASQQTLFELEKKTLQQINVLTAFANLGEIYTQAKSAMNSLRPGAIIDVHLGFCIQGGLRSDRGSKIKRRFDVSATVTPESNRISTASYAVVICDGEDPATSNVLRKFHFDYESYRDRNSQEAKPTTHLQICGKFSKHHLNNLKYTNQQIDHWKPAFEKPRIPVAPTSLALLLNWIFLEFQSVHQVNQILRNSHWKTVVHEAEQKILRPYYEGAANYLSSAANEGGTFVDKHLYARI